MQAILSRLAQGEKSDKLVCLERSLADGYRGLVVDVRSLKDTKIRIDVRVGTATLLLPLAAADLCLRGLRYVVTYAGDFAERLPKRIGSGAPWY